VDRVSEAIQPHYEAIAAKARSAQVNYIDETAWYQHGVLAWLWVMVNTWTFVVEEGVEPTNNRAERALRFAVLWRKSMQGSYNAQGDRWVERILSLRETCRLRGKPTFPVLVHAVTCSFNGQHPDISWI
jgi:hypothetical protein